MWSPIGWLKSRNECCNLSIGLYIVLAPLYLKYVRKLQEKRFVFVKILAIIIPENGAKVSKIKCFQFAQQTLIRGKSADTEWKLRTETSKQNTYYGYWIYEAGSICKILRLDDEELKEQQYYPYDLVHFNE